MASTSKIFSALRVKQSAVETKLNQAKGDEEQLTKQQQLLTESRTEADQKISTWQSAKPSSMLKNCFAHREKTAQAVTIAAHRAQALAKTKHELQSEIQRYSSQKSILFNQHQLRAQGLDKKREQHETDELNITRAQTKLGA